jgi:hypothetical protein
MTKIRGSQTFLDSDPDGQMEILLPITALVLPWTSGFLQLRQASGAMPL